MSQSSVRFDRASNYYDETRALSALAMASILAQVVPEVEPLGRALEIGVGTGRFALPLADAGVEMAGIDISRPMLAKLVEKSGGSTPFPLVEADATRLPFADDAFGAAISVHVLHLIGDWQAAADELLRTVKPGGKILVDFGGFGEGLWWDLTQVFARGAELSLDFVGAASEEEVDSAFEQRGAAVRFLEPVRDFKRLPYRTFVRFLEDGIFSFTWSATPEQLKRGAASLRAELEERGVDIDDMMENEREVVWRVYDLPT